MDEIKNFLDSLVAPFAGAWIEIYCFNHNLPICASHPSRVRGLKLYANGRRVPYRYVAPFAGAWIEIYSAVDILRRLEGRTLRGCVD